MSVKSYRQIQKRNQEKVNKQLKAAVATCGVILICQLTCAALITNEFLKVEIDGQDLLKQCRFDKQVLGRAGHMSVTQIEFIQSRSVFYQNDFLGH